MKRKLFELPRNWSLRSGCVLRVSRAGSLSWGLHTVTLALGLWFAFGVRVVAAPPTWVTLTKCQYVVTQEGDGDSFRIRSGTNEYNVRLYFVDAPETNLRFAERNHEQAEHFGITIDETGPAGVKAKEVTRELLREPFTVRTRWATAGGAGREPRYYSFVEVGTNSLAALLVAQG